MGDIILVEYEKTRGKKSAVQETGHLKGLFFLILIIILLVVNQVYIYNLFVQTGLNMLGFFAAFLLFYGQWKKREAVDRQSLMEYAGDMECMEKVLYCLDIDTYNKLGLVIDEVRARIMDDEEERKKKEKISVVSIVALTGMLSLICLYRGGDIDSYVELGSILNFFLMVLALLLACVYIGARLFSANQKYKWLYKVLLNVMITKF
ncbi:MAG: hypothetical protein J1F22_01435 [Lachnospiraceae bacterium]|nr:hypothetical protein [Lachnospiraceae bacterium]